MAAFAGANVGATRAMRLVTRHARLVTGDPRAARGDVRGRLRESTERGPVRRAPGRRARHAAVGADVTSLARAASSLLAGMRSVAHGADLSRRGLTWVEFERADFR